MPVKVKINYDPYYDSPDQGTERGVNLNHPRQKDQSRFTNDNASEHLSFAGAVVESSDSQERADDFLSDYLGYEERLTTNPYRDI